MVQIPDGKLGKYMMEQQIVSLFFCARLAGQWFLQLFSDLYYKLDEVKKDFTVAFAIGNFIFTSFSTENLTFQ